MNAHHILLWWREPSALQMAVRELEDSKRALLLAQSSRELYEAHETMLANRIARLKADINVLNLENGNDSSSDN